MIKIFGSLCIFAAIVLLVYSLAGLAVSLAAQDPLTVPEPRLMEITIRPTTAPAGAFVTFAVEAKMLVAKLGQDGRVQEQKLEVVHFDLTQTNGQIVLDGEILDDREAMDHLAAIIVREWKKANPDALPVRRRTLRSK